MTAEPNPGVPAFMSWDFPTEEIVTDLAYGLTEAHIWQDERCAICGRRRNSGSRRYALDHDHATGLVRGVLCNRCNTQEGMSSDLIYRRYREGMNPCALFGWNYLWQFDRAPKPIGAKEVLARKFAAIIREEELEVATREAFDAVRFDIGTPEATTTASGSAH